MHRYKQDKEFNERPYTVYRNGVKDQARMNGGSDFPRLSER